MKFILGLFIISTVLLSGCAKPQDTADYSAFAKCLTANGATMYGAEWCSHCKAQKELFGAAFQFVDYVDCDKYKDDCATAGIEGYPTWKIGDKLYPGTQNLYILASKTGCEEALTSAQAAK